MSHQNGNDTLIRNLLNPWEPFLLLLRLLYLI